MNVDTVYAQIVSGERSGAPPGMARWLTTMAHNAAASLVSAQRLGALRVASAVPMVHGLAITRALVRDADTGVRRAVLAQAKGARYEGLDLIRQLAEDPHPDIAEEALGLLQVALDRQATATLRRVLRGNSPQRVKRRAIELLGHIAGPAVKIDLRAFEDVEDEATQKVLAEALERLNGERERALPATWWDGADLPHLPAPPPVVERRGSPATPAPTPRADEQPPESPESPEQEDPQAVQAEPLAAPAGDTGAVQTPPPAQATDDGAPPQPHPEHPPIPAPPVPDSGSMRHASLPWPLPTESRALLRLLGLVGPADHAPVINALRSAAEGELASLLSQYRGGRDEALGRGLGLASAHLGSGAWCTDIRRLAGDDSPAVRSAAATALGALGRVSIAPALSRLLEDPEPIVRVAAIHALANLCHRVQRGGLGRSWLGPLADDAHAEVRDAATTALAELPA